MSPRRVRFTQADLARCIRAAQQCNAGEVRVLPDGTIEIDVRPDVVSSTRHAERASKWDDAYSRPESSRPERRRIGDRLFPKGETGANPLVIAYDRMLRGEITWEELPPGEYPDGMRVYADGEWEAIVRSRPLGKLERSTLRAYFDADGKSDFYSGGPATNEKLEARGLIEISAPKQNDRMPFYRITGAGKAEHLRLSSESVASASVDI